VVQAHAREHCYRTSAEEEESERREKVVQVRVTPARPRDTHERGSARRDERTRCGGDNLDPKRSSRGET
jgi:hypothetical protein